MNDKRIMLFTNCKVVKGFKRSAIYDLGRNEFKFIPNSLADILSKFNRKTISELFLNYSEEDHGIIKEYLDFLLENEYIQFCDSVELGLFPELDLEYLNAGQISNAVISFSTITLKHLDKLITQLVSLGCKHLEIRNNSPMGLLELSNHLNSFDGSPIKSINLITIYHTDYNETSFESLIENNKRVVSTIIYDSTFNISNKTDSIIFSKKKLDELLMQKPSPKSFNINMRLYCESLSFNNYFNNKICIDELGNIKNSLKNAQIFGNINNISLFDSISVTGFKTLWYVKKDDIQTCKACEFRYMCVDARIPIDAQDCSWFFDSECDYNPFTAKWSNEENYISVKEYMKLSIENKG